MTVRVRTILDEITRRNTKGSWDFTEKGFTCYIGGRYNIYGFLDRTNPDSIAENVIVTYQGVSDNTHIGNAVLLEIAKRHSFRLTKETSGDLEFIAKTDEEFIQGLLDFEKVEKEYRKAVSSLAEVLAKHIPVSPQ